jgi:hypothetical protein
MGTIYSTANDVIVWLGEATSNEKPIFSFFPIRHHGRVDTGARFLRRKVSRKVRASMTTLLGKPYWSRMWIIQEFLLAQSLEIWCGRYCAKFDDFFYTNRLLNMDGKGTESAWTLLKMKGDYPLSGTRFYDLEDLVPMFKAAQCKEKVDRIYALLAVTGMSNASPHPIIPDYNKSPVEVLLEVLRNQMGPKQWLSLSEQRHFEHCRAALGVSRTDIAQYVVAREVHLDTHIINLVSCFRPTASLRFIGSVTKCAHYQTPLGAESNYLEPHYALDILRLRAFH